MNDTAAGPISALMSNSDAATYVLDAYRATWARGGARARRAVVLREHGAVTRTAQGPGEVDFGSGWSSSIITAPDGNGVEVRKLGFRTYQRELSKAGPAQRWRLVDLGRLRTGGPVARDHVSVLESALVGVRHHGRRDAGTGPRDVFVVTVDLASMEDDAGIGGVMQQAFEDTPLHRFELELDREGTVRSERSVLAGPTDEGLECFRCHSTSSLELLELGITVNIEEPAPADVDDVTESTAAMLFARSVESGSQRTPP